MLTLLGRILLGLACAVMVISAFHAATVLFFGFPSGTWPIQTLTNPRSSYLDETTRAELLIPNLSQLSRPMILVVGASSAQEAYSPDLVEAEAPGYDSHNLAIAATNMTELNQELHHIADVTPASWLRQSILLICVNYANFASDDARWRDPLIVPAREVFASTLKTDVERSGERCLLSCGGSRAASKFVPAWFLRLWDGHYLLYLKMTQHLPSPLVQGTLPLQRLWSIDPRQFLKTQNAERTPDARPDPPAGKRAVEGSPDQLNELRFVNTLMGNPPGGIGEEQFDVLLDVIRFAQSKGLRVVIVDMPLTSWHRQASTFFEPYEAKLKSTLEPLLRKHALDLISLADALPDDTFRDTSHPLPSKAAMWTDVLFARLRTIVSAGPDR